MALETLEEVKDVDDYEIVHLFNDLEIQHSNHCLSAKKSIFVNHQKNWIAFKIQDGPISEKGHNGCQIDSMIHVAKLILEGLNKKHGCRENSIAITKLDEALLWLEKRRKDRVLRGVEGTDKD
jgi:uncharacterized Fe-S cluster protein YjdI